jgi:hypothetical protein
MNISKGMIGRAVSKETRAKIGAANSRVLTGRKLSIAHIAAISAAHTGKIKTKAHRAALSRAAKRDWKRRKAKGG